MDDVTKSRFQLLKHRYGSLSDASSYRSELNGQIANPEDEELNSDDISRAKVIRDELNEYLELGEQR